MKITLYKRKEIVKCRGNCKYDVEEVIFVLHKLEEGLGISIFTLFRFMVAPNVKCNAIMREIILYDV